MKHQLLEKIEKSFKALEEYIREGNASPSEIESCTLLRHIYREIEPLAISFDDAANYLEELLLEARKAKLEEPRWPIDGQFMASEHQDYQDATQAIIENNAVLDVVPTLLSWIEQALEGDHAKT